MIKEFTIEGVENAVKCFDNLKVELLNPRESLNKSARFMREEALRNFPAEGGVFGESWPPLKSATIRRKEKEGYGNQPMMVRTGELFRSFFVNISKDRAEVYNPVSYAIEHQKGNSIKNLPRRVLLKLAIRQIQGITNIFSNWVSNSVVKSFSG